MKLFGLTRINDFPELDAMATLEWKRGLSFHATSSLRANPFNNQYPALWRVPEYSGPGFPRPTIAIGDTSHTE
jgi:hypothetical protein